MMKYIFRALLLLFAGPLAAQLPSANFTSHTNGQTLTSPNITITWKGCSNATQSSYTTRLRGVAIATTQSNTFPCPDYQIGKNYSASGTLVNGPNNLFISVCDISGCGEKTITVNYDAPAVSVTPDGATEPSLAEGASSSYAFKVRNTGAHSATATFSYSCNPHLSCSATAPPAFIAHGDSVTVTVSYTGATPGSGRATLTATYNEFPGVTDDGFVNVFVNSAPLTPVASFIFPGDSQVFTNPNITVTWKGCSHRAQTSGSAWLNGVGLNTTETSTIPQCPNYPFAKDYSAPATLLNGPNNISIKVCDAVECSLTAEVIVRYSAPAVSVTPDGGTAPPVPQAASGSYVFKVKNTGEQSGTILLTRSCTVQLTSCSVAPDSVYVIQGDSVMATMSYTGASAGAGRATLTARYKEFPGITDDGYVDVTVNTEPHSSVTVTPVNPTQTVSAGNVTVQFDVTNTSQGTSTASTFDLTPSVGGSVSSCSPVNQVTLAPGAAATRVNVNCTVGTSGTAGSVKLKASTTSPAPFEGEGITNLAITPVYRIAVSPAVGTAAVPVGTGNTYSVVIQNTSSNTSLPIAVSLPSPTCTGGKLAHCSIATNNASIAQGSETSPITLSYDAIATGNETVTFSPSGTVSGGTVQVTPGTLSVTVGTVSQSLTVAVAGRNPGTTIDKASCLTVAAGQNAAYECSDLRVVHPLPATATMDRARAPALMFNSRHANPGALLAADVTYSGAPPTTLKATVAIAGQADIPRDFTWSPQCAGAACRIVVPISTTQPTGLYAVTLQVSAMNGTTVISTSAPVTDTVMVVNRAASPFGAGWWLDGMESLVTLSATRMLWVGGDGSTRLYSRSADTTVYTVTPAYDRPDTLKRVLTAPQTWRRSLGDTAYVEFNSAGQHVKTVNGLGWTTTFEYTGGLLSSITLPVPAGSPEVRRYSFWYTSSLLDSVQAPKVALSRTTHVMRAGTPKINSITDPDGFATAFGYDGSNRIVTRRNKLSDTTYFQYDDGGALKQSRQSTARTNGPGSAITTNFRSAETRSAYTSLDLPALAGGVYTQLDGPRTDVGDTTNIIINRWGAPDSVTNALGQRTRVSRASAAFPALATKVIAANGLETRAFYNSRGLADSTVAVDPYNNGENATTRYAWNPRWNQVDSIIRPMNERTRTFYRTTRPIVDSMRIGAQASRRVKFTYTADNQVRSVTEPASLPDSVTYDALGNASRTWTPMGRSAATPYFTEFQKDAIGRDTIVVTADTTGTAVIKYDAGDRVVWTLSYGPPRPYSLPLSPSFVPDTAIVGELMRVDSSAYDAEGNLVFKRAVSSVGDVQVNDRLTYDAAGRLTKRLVGTGPDSMVYDPAGNLISARHKSGSWVTQSYDVLNRLTTRVVPEINHSQQRCEGMPTGPIAGPGPLCLMIFPYYANAGTSLRIPADTARFVYDSFGNMTQANNLYARLRRTYYRNGALKSDSTAMGDYVSPRVDGFTVGQQYMYDRSGRRTAMQWMMGPTTYSYNDFGALNTVTDVANNQYRFVYTPSGQIDSLLLGSGVREKRTYDADGRRVFRTRMSSVPAVGFLVSDSLRYDKMNRITRAWQQVRLQSPDQTLISYDGLGAVVAKEQGGQFGSSIEEFRNDEFGNVLRRLTRRTAGLINNAPFAMTYGMRGELTSAFAQLKTPPEGSYQRQDQLSQGFSNGRLVRQGQLVRNPNNGDIEHQVGARYYYGADDRLMTVQRYSFRNPALRDGTWEEYRYDALGRRILTRVRRHDAHEVHPATVSGPLCQSSTIPLCRSYTETVWWDGDTDQALVESRAPEGPSDVSNYGLVGNIHGLTLDEPLAVISAYTAEFRIINYNWRGQGLSSVYPNGNGADHSTGGGAEVDWPAATQAQTYFTPAPELNPSNNPKLWLGTFVANGQGTTGMLYRRNRYFDPKSGQFTQEDPLGIAGGLNAYGFGDGDPINFKDPFGLCPQWLTGKPCSGGVDIGFGFVPILSTGIDVATALSGENPLTGEQVGLLGRGIAMAGILTPTSGGQIRGLLTGGKHALSEGLLRVTLGFTDKALLNTYHGAIDQINRHKKILAKASSEQINSINKDIVKHERRLQAAIEEMGRRGIRP